MNPGFPAAVPPSVEPFSLVIGATRQRYSSWVRTLMEDSRFRVTSFAFDPEDLKLKLKDVPEALLLEAGIMGDEGALLKLLAGLPCPVYVVVPLQDGQNLAQRLREMQNVKGAFVGDLNLLETTGRMYSDLNALRSSRNVSLQAWSQPGSAVPGIAPLRIITVWNQMGGVGKTTISTNLAYESARRGYPTLLIGLGAPDDMPLVAGIRPDPNITRWWNHPTIDAIKLAIQKLDTLDVLAGFPDVLSESEVLNAREDAPNSIARLITTAAHYLGYAVIVIDAPPSAVAANAIKVSNTLVMVARPSLEGVMRTVEAYRTVVEHLPGEHRIAAERVFVVLNRVGGRLSADEWHRAASQQANRPFPPIIAQIPDNVAVGAAQDNRRMPVLVVDEFNRCLRPLVDALLNQSSTQSTPVQNGHTRSYKIGPIRFKV